MRPRTSGRVLVRVIFASCAGSMSIFSALAQADERAVPAVRLRSVSGERLIEVERGVMATGKSEYAVVVVRTMRKVRRGFERDR